LLSLVPILLVLAVLLADGGFVFELGLATPDSELGRVVGLSVGPVLLVAAGASVVVSALRRRIGRGRSLRAAVRTGDRCLLVARWLLLLNYLFTVLVIDALGAARELAGGWILIGELLVMLPPILGLLWLWWIWYPIERRLHETALLHRLDRGLPVHLPPGRWPYVLTQLRLHILLMLVPMLLILGLSQVLEGFLETDGREINLWAELGTGFVAISVLGASPLIARWLLGLRRLPDGSIRIDLESICARHGVRVRDIMLWRTGGTMINAAVMGLVRHLRYVVLTDGLIEQLPRRQVQAVMAHEVGHVRHRHMIWLLVCLLSTLVLGQWSLELLVDLAPEVFREPAGPGAVLQLVVVLAVIFLLFGWMSRRFERQADTFAVQHLVAESECPDRIDSESVLAMVGALDSIALLQAIDPRRRSWRHGSIAWRTEYLQSLIGRPVDGLAIDRTMVLIRVACGIIVAIGILQLIMEAIS
tara:strand:- start:6881 stop:8302 length:1422 start_codon:yes stop_codon:yes gene_type:complete